MHVRKIFSLGLALVAGFALLAPVTASAQHGQTVLAWARVDGVSALPDQSVRVTVVNPKLVGPLAASQGSYEYVLEAEGLDGTVTIAPGEAYTFTLDPRLVGELIDPRTGARRVVVNLSVYARVPDRRSAPDPAVTVDLVNTTTGATEAIVAFPNFTGGVRVAAGDVN